MGRGRTYSKLLEHLNGHAKQDAISHSRPREHFGPFPVFGANFFLAEFLVQVSHGVVDDSMINAYTVEGGDALARLVVFAVAEVESR